MSKKNTKTTLVAFKVETELAELLSQLPNKSDFIRTAILAQLGMHCPLCSGKGTVPRFVHDHFAPLILADRQRACVSCGDKLMLPKNSKEIAPTDVARLEQFFHGGPLYCGACFKIAAPCDECWHIDGDRVAEHKNLVHPAQESHPIDDQKECRD